MRAPAAISLVAGLTLAVVSAVVVTGVRSEAANAHPHPATSTAALVRAPQAGAMVTVPTLAEAGGGADASAAAGSSAAAQVSAQAAARVQADARADEASQLAADQLAATRAAAAKAAAIRASSSAAAASSVAAASRSVAAASSAAASRSAASSAAAAARSSSAAASSSSVAAASSSAASSSAAASSAAASQAAAAGSLAAASRSAAGEPAPDTTEAVEAAVAAANLTGVTESVVVMNRSTGSVTTSVNADAEVPSMSLVKLMLAADVIDRAGGIDQIDDDTLAQLHQMIAVSDDSIAQAFYDGDGRSAIITRVSRTYGLTGTSPAPDPEYWGDVRTTARDMSTLLYQLLSNPDTGLWFSQAMQAAEDTGADGFDQDFGVNALPGTGSKQGWGCCLADVLAIHSVGFTAGQIVVVLSTSDPDAASSKLSTARELTGDPGVRAAKAAVTSTAAAAFG